MLTQNKTYPCKLYTLDGTFPAHARINPLRGIHETVNVKSDCDRYSINVYRGLAEGKFWQEENPTFYAC